MRNVILGLLAGCLSFGFMGPGVLPAQAQDFIPLYSGVKADGSDNPYDDILSQNILARKVQNKPSQYSIFDIIKTSGFIVRVNIVVGTIALMYLVLLVIKYVTSLGEEEKLQQYKKQVGFVLIGLCMVSIAEYVGFQVLNPGQEVVGGGLSGEQSVVVRNVIDKVEQIFKYFLYIAGGLMLINGLFTGYDLIVRSEDEETISKEKRFLRSYLLGVILILSGKVLSKVFVLQVGKTGAETFREGGAYLPGDKVDYNAIIPITQEIMGIVNYMITFVGVAATFMMILASIYYVTSIGDEERTKRAKNIVVACVAGIILSFSAFTLAAYMSYAN